MRWFKRRKPVKPEADFRGGAKEVRVIVGLGNPGGEYEQTRHNAGFWVIDALCEKFGADVKKKKFAAMFGEVELGDKKLILLKPLSYMNRSGQSTATASGFYRAGLDKIMVVSDCMDIEPGRIKLKAGGSAGGHNGLADVIAKLGSDEFARVRIGIGRPERGVSKDYVLGRPGAEEKKLIESACQKAADAVICWAEKGIDAAMNEFNTQTDRWSV